MQLFLTDFVLKWDDLVIENKEILEQFRKVMRWKKWDSFSVQKVDDDGLVKNRYIVKVDDRDDKKIISSIVEKTENKKNLWNKKKMYIAMPNKRDKIELIVQKLTELGIDEIIFWVAERSVLRQWNDKKIERLNKIIKEAVEQSWSWTMPVLRWEFSDFVVDGKGVVFDKNDEKLKSWIDEKLNWKNIWVVGPEGGLTENDYRHFKNFEVCDLGENVLRMETASIIGAWVLKSYK